MSLNKKFSRELRDITSKLILSLTNFKESSENYESCVKYSLSNFYFHRFLSADSHKIHRQIDGLVEKFLVHSQPEKSCCLKEMFELFLEKNLSEKSFSKSSVHYCLIAILLSLSENALYHKFEKVLPPQKQAIKDDFDWTAYLLNGEDFPRNWPWDASSESEEDDFAEGNVETTVIEEKPLVNTLNFPEELTESLKLPNVVNNYWKLPVLLVNTELHCSLNSPLTVMKNKTNVKEINVIREVIWLFSGHKNLFVFPEQSGKHIVSPHVHLSHLTNAALQNALNIYAKCGDIVGDLRTFVFTPKMHITLTYQAFAASLGLYFKWLMQDLVDIENKVRLQKESYFLDDLKRALSIHIRILQLIYHIYCSSITLDKENEKNSVKSSRLLSVLYQNLLNESCVATASDSPGVELTLVDVLFNLWLDSSRPYVEIIDKWVNKGVLEDQNNEFLIRREHAVADCQQIGFWSEALVPNVDDVGKVGPWLSFFLDKIVTGGKSMEILKTLCILVNENYPDFVLPTRDDFLNQPIYDSFVYNLALKPQLQGSDVCVNLVSNAIDQKQFKKDKILLNSNFSRLLQTPMKLANSKANLDKHFTNERPLTMLIVKALDPVIKLKCDHANRRLVEVLKLQFNLSEKLDQFHNFHLMAWGDVMHHFSVGICENLADDSIVNDLIGINILMQEAVSFSSTDHRVFVNLKAKTNEEKRDGGLFVTKKDEKVGRHCPIDVTDCIELQWNVEWPISLVITEDCIQTYNKLFSYLMQIKRALYCVESLKFSTIYKCPAKSGQSFKRLQNSNAAPMSFYEKRHRMAILRARILHLLQHWHGFVMTSVIQAEKHVFSLKLADAETLDDILLAHKTFLERICSLCLLDKKSQASTMVQGTLKKIMTLAITFSALWNCGIDLIHDRSLLKHEATFHECSEFLGRILKTIANRGAVPILDSLAYAILS